VYGLARLEAFDQRPLLTQPGELIGGDPASDDKVLHGMVAIESRTNNVGLAHKLVVQPKLRVADDSEHCNLVRVRRSARLEGLAARMFIH
jgi:hypothetical protein